MVDVCFLQFSGVVVRACQLCLRLQTQPENRNTNPIATRYVRWYAIRLATFREHEYSIVYNDRATSRAYSKPISGHAGRAGPGLRNESRPHNTLPLAQQSQHKTVKPCPPIRLRRPTERNIYIVFSPMYPSPTMIRHNTWIFHVRPKGTNSYTVGRAPRISAVRQIVESHTRGSFFVQRFQDVYYMLG